MKKLYFIQTTSIIGLLISLIFARYTLITIFHEYISLEDLFIVVSIFFSIKNKVISSFIMLIYSIYFFINVGIFLSVPKLIFSAFQDGAYQYGFNFLFQLINLLI
ncbi:hypothetical protein [Francisella orientalis]|uniref:Uncharacterized protein n=1 Tax=Francisella orientalis TaxID=299583 RepID=A0AAP7C666_9GAMM|nr:hypothetical protein [Francisella orientalis]AFJ44111.1 hypothetical protein OOM_1758 [Francisella orientalis str. Toba 04]AHB99215.1 hypothetical protein M973_06130 [Francisella orientalis LADL 07-285A]AKN85715.1 hypothetical protein FNO12_1089 [Francisella orientalis FNO12]AKN87255.1 Hypothetical protein FNO24_1091 [Francisella orientalis FNO24]AKN88792.1 Hypothetical protein FNO190_1089 [Francisella orientalis]